MELDETLREKLKEVGYDVTRLEDGRKMVLITGHRRENFGDGFINICKAIKTLIDKYPNVDFIYPMHLNLMYVSRFMKFLEKIYHVLEICSLLNRWNI